MINVRSGPEMVCVPLVSQSPSLSPFLTAPTGIFTVVVVLPFNSDRYQSWEGFAVPLPRLVSFLLSPFFASNRPDTSRGSDTGQIPVVGAVRRNPPTTGICTFVRVVSFKSARYQSWEGFTVPCSFPQIGQIPVVGGFCRTVFHDATFLTNPQVIRPRGRMFS